MILNLTDLSSEPLQTQIYRQIRAMILAEEINSGDILPSIRKLARNEKVSVITVQRGYEQLEKEGLIVSRRGKGFFVSEMLFSQKKELAEKRLAEKLLPIIKTAQNEGMKDFEIEAIIKNVINNNL